MKFDKKLTWCNMVLKYVTGFCGAHRAEKPHTHTDTRVELRPDCIASQIAWPCVGKMQDGKGAGQSTCPQPVFIK